MRGLIAALFLFCLGIAARAGTGVADDAGHTLHLAVPAARIVSLSPDMTENLFAIGAGDRLVGTVEFSNYPPAALAVARIGGYERFDLERVVALKPDLVLAWQSGNNPSQIARLMALGVPVYVSQSTRVEDVAGTLERLGRLTGQSAQADRLAQAYAGRIAALRARHAGQPVVRVFYQAWNAPLMTVGGRQVISDVIRLCGGENVFGTIRPMAAAVSVEAVLAANPEVIIASGRGDRNTAWLDEWRRWPKLVAVARDNLFLVPPDHLQRHTLRLAEGVEALCAHLETARARRPRQPSAQDFPDRR